MLARASRTFRCCAHRAPCFPPRSALPVVAMGGLFSRNHVRSGQSSHVAAAQPATLGSSASAPSSANAPYLIVGLGNPGTQYENTRHNIGFEAIDYLAQSNGLTWGKKLEHGALVATGSVKGAKVILCKPMTFMNNSGESVAPLARYYKVPLDKILVIFDDIDSDAGVVKIKMKGGHGGHNGIRSIIARSGDQKDFPRVKIGVGRPPGQQQVATYVLGKFAKSEAGMVADSVQEAVRIAEAVCGLGLELAISGKRL